MWGSQPENATGLTAEQIWKTGRGKGDSKALYVFMLETPGK